MVHYCRGQSLIALSSGEAEYYSLVTLAGELHYILSMALDWNLDFKVQVSIDATAAIGMVSRRGLGRAKHIDTVWLWAQEWVEQNKVKLVKRHTDDMLADLLTKFPAQGKVEKFLKGLGFVSAQGSHQLALEA